jgi:hypothetical protein
VVAVLDTGVDYRHEDLLPNLWRNTGEDWVGPSPGHNGVDDDQDGYVDNYYGIDLVSSNGDPMDDVGHGTHVAGIIGAVGDNSRGISGVSWKLQILSIKFLGREGGTVGDEIEGITHVLALKDRGVPVIAINASFGGYDYSLFEREAINAARAAGIVVVASAGNAGQVSDVDGHYPSGYNLDNIISVGATDQKDRLTFFTNQGKVTVHIGVPGVMILSTLPGGTYGRSSGTSMAAPQVTGIYALLHNALSGEGYLSIKDRILAGADRKDHLTGKVLAGGRINAYRALAVDASAPYLYWLGRAEGSPGAQVRIAGIHFGSEQGPGHVTFPPGIEATIQSWSDSAIVCSVPQGATSGRVTVDNPQGTSNSLPFNVVPYRYRFPFASSRPPWISVLVLNNWLLDRSLEVKVFGVSYESSSLQERTLTLNPAEQRYLSLDDIGIYQDHAMVWLECEQQLGALLLLLNPGLGGVPIVKPHLW